MVCYSNTLLDKQFNEIQWSVTCEQRAIHTNLTQSQFNVLSGGLIECLDEPRHVGVCAAGSPTTTTLLSIPQWVSSKYCIPFICTTDTNTRLTKVVSTNTWRSNACRVLLAWTIVIKVISSNIVRTTSPAYVQMCLRGALLYVTETPSTYRHYQ